MPHLITNIERSNKMSQRSNSEQYFLIVEQFIEKIFLYPDIMQKHVEFMKKFPDIEWFNIAGILLQKPDASFVKSKPAWDEYCKENTHIQKGAKSIRIAVPRLESNLEFVLVPCYDVQDIEDNNIRYIESPIQKVIDRFQGIDRINSLLNSKNIGLEECVKNMLLEEPFFCSLNDEEQITVKDCILLSILKDIKLSALKTTQSMNIYYFIKEMIAILPNYISGILIDFEEREQKKDERKDIILQAKRTVTERKISAQRIYYQRINNAGREKIIEDIEYLDDEGIPIPMESEVY